MIEARYAAMLYVHAVFLLGLSKFVSFGRLTGRCHSPLARSAS
jgi:hypothetical protein